MSSLQPYFTILRDTGIVPTSDLDAVAHLSALPVVALERVLQEQGVQLSVNTLWQVIAKALNKPFVSLSNYTPSTDLLTSIPTQICQLYGVLPIGCEEGRREVALRDPCDIAALQAVEFALGSSLHIVVAPSARVDALILTHYGELGSPLAKGDTDPTEGEELETPVSDYVDQVLHKAVREGASDIHFEPFESEFKIRYRVDGNLLELPSPPVRLTLAMVSRLKVLAQMNIAEMRVPQDGRIQISIASNPVELRVSSLPTQYGESIVCRILDRSTITLDLPKLGLPPTMQHRVQELIQRPNGIFLVTGPTGAGKTTTLYATLRELNTEDIKILTAEDPVEYDIEGIMQVAINDKIGLTFSKVLRSLLRQDPDKLLVGEIRDPETALMTIQAALTGHFVLSTLHTNDAVGAITRLIDMGAEPFLIATALQGVLAQRLVRRLCPNCRQPYQPTPSVLEQLAITDVSVPMFYHAVGCVACEHTGYKGRQGLFEFLVVDASFHQPIIEKAPSLMLKQQAIASGMKTLRQDGIRHIYAGVTTVEEVLKYT